MMAGLGDLSGLQPQLFCDSICSFPRSLLLHANSSWYFPKLRASACFRFVLLKLFITVTKNSKNSLSQHLGWIRQQAWREGFHFIYKQTEQQQKYNLNKETKNRRPGRKSPAVSVTWACWMLSLHILLLLKGAVLTWALSLQEVKDKREADKPAREGQIPKVVFFPHELMSVEPISVCEQSISAAAPGSSGTSSRDDASIHEAKPLSVTRGEVCLHFPAIAIGIRTTCPK